MTDREIMQQALEALDYEAEKSNDFGAWLDIRKALSERLAQSEQEPVAWKHKHIDGVSVTHLPADIDRHPERWTALYPEPRPCPTCEALARTVMMDQTAHDLFLQPRQWQGLTDEEKAELDAEYGDDTLAHLDAVEAKLKEKNHG